MSEPGDLPPRPVVPPATYALAAVCAVERGTLGAGAVPALLPAALLFLLVASAAAVRGSRLGAPARVAALASENNSLLAHYLCRGSIDLNRTAQRLKIPEGEKGHLSPERFEKQKQSLGHPDGGELAACTEAVRAAAARLNV